MTLTPDNAHDVDSEVARYSLAVRESRDNPRMSPPGWAAFDPQLVDELRRAGGGADAPCPHHEHPGHRLEWQGGDYRNGTEFHGSPPASFRVSPTYVLEDPRDNFIIDGDLLAKLTGKAETWRLGNENSEDAVSFNVFRSLQEAGTLRAAAQVLVGQDVGAEPELIVWGSRIANGGATPVPELQAALNRLEPWAGQKSEPDVILRAPGWGWIFVEAKLASKTSTLKGKPEKLKAWGGVYGASGAFDLAAIAAADPAAFPEQLLRNVAVARQVAGKERAAVVALVRGKAARSVAEWSAGYLTGEEILTGIATWEQLYGLTTGHPRLADLRDYMAGKSVNLRPAFAVTSGDTAGEGGH